MKWFDKFKDMIPDEKVDDNPTLIEEPVITLQEQEDQKIEEMMSDVKDDAYIPELPPITTMDTTSINKETEVVGEIHTDEDIIIYGNVKGNVTCHGHLSLHGWIEGTIVCADGTFDQAIALGDVHCSGTLDISATSSINGNVETLNLISGGRIKGDVLTLESAKFNATAATVGNVQARDIEIERGAIIQGNIRMLQDIDIEA